MTSHLNNPNDMFAAQNGMAKEMHSEKMGTRMAYNQADILKYNNQQLAEQLPYLSPGEKNINVENTQYMPTTLESLRSTTSIELLFTSSWQD